MDFGALHSPTVNKIYVSRFPKRVNSSGKFNAGSYGIIPQTLSKPNNHKKIWLM